MVLNVVIVVSSFIGDFQCVWVIQSVILEFGMMFNIDIYNFVF